MAPETAIAVTEKSVGQYVNDTLPAMIKSYSVRPYDAQVWIRTVKLCIVENPDLMACLQTEAGRISLNHALRFAATTGLSLNPQEGMAALVPIEGKVNYWPMKNGLVQLVLDTGLVDRIRMNAVHANDHWKLVETLDGDRYEWSPARRERGDIESFFAAAKLKDGTSVVEFMTREEVEEHKKKYGKGTSKPGSAWNTSFEGMGIKTVTKRLCNRLKIPASSAPALKAALADGEPEPAEFTVTPPQKGTGAGDLERKLAEQKPPEEQVPQRFAEGAPGPVTAAPAPAGAQEATPPAQPEIF